MFDSSIYGKVLVIDGYFLVKVVYFFLFLLSQLFNHIIARNEHSLEVTCVRKCAFIVFYFVYKVVFAIGLRVILHCLYLGLNGGLLLDEWIFEVIYDSLVGLFWMSIVVCSLTMNIKSRWCLPTRFTFKLFFLSLYMFIDKWEGL